jgi:hypothetical protein
VLLGYREQLRVLHLVAPTAIAIHDQTALQWHPRSWWIDVLETRTPPSPENLFTVHAVRGEHAVWLHTHGLGRAGSIELEILDAPLDSVREVSALLHHAALYMLENGSPAAGAFRYPHLRGAERPAGTPGTPPRFSDSRTGHSARHSLTSPATDPT